MKKLIFILLLFTTSVFAAQDIIPEPLEGKPVDVIAVNEEIRKTYDKIDTEIADVNADITTANAAITALTVRVEVLEASSVSSEKLVKGWVVFDGTTNTAGYCTILDSYNVDSVADNGVGDYTITWTTDFASVNYAVAGWASRDSGSNSCYVTAANASPLATSSARILVIKPADTPNDTSLICVMAIGDQP